MKTFEVEFTEQAKTDIDKSFEWGNRNWGTDQALKWYRELRAAARERLSRFPTGMPIAPESDELGHEVRQLIFGRYRLVFEIVENTVRIVHVSGPYVEKDKRLLGELE